MDLGFGERWSRPTCMCWGVMGEKGDTLGGPCTLTTLLRVSSHFESWPTISLVTRNTEFSGLDPLTLLRAKCHLWFTTLESRTSLPFERHTSQDMIQEAGLRLRIYCFTVIGEHSFQAPRGVQVSKLLFMELGVHWTIPLPTEVKMNFRKL